MLRAENVAAAVAGPPRALKTRSRDPLAAAALLALAVLALHYDVVFLGRSLVQTNYLNPLDQRASAANYGPGFVPHTEWADRNLWLFANIRDPGTSWWQWEPSTQFLKQAIAAREWPFWNPYVGAGTPAMANLLPSFFFPPYALMVSLGGSIALRNAYFLFLLWSAGFLSYLFLRRHDLTFAASVGGGVIVVMSGAMNQYLGSIAGQTGACLPLALLATRWFLDSPAGRRIAVLAIVYATIALSSLPPMLVGAFAVTALYAFVAVLGEASTSKRSGTALRWLGAVAISIGLVAFYMLPAAALSRAATDAAIYYRGAGLQSMPLVNLLQFLSPTLMGGVQVYLDAPFATAGYAGHIPYVGAACLALCAAARWPQGARRRTLYTACVAGSALLLLKLFGVPPVQWAAWLPFFEHIHFAHYLGVPLGFVIAYLAAQGFDDLVRGSVSAQRAVLVSAISIVAVAAPLLIAWRTNAFDIPGASDWIRDWIVVSLAAAAAAAAIGVTSWRRRGPTVRLALSAILAVIVAEGTYSNRHPKPQAWDLFEHAPPYLRLIRKEAPLARILAFGVPPANVNGAFRVYGLNSTMPFNPPRIYALYRRYASASIDVFLTLPKQIPPEPVLDSAHVQFIGAYTPIASDVALADARGYTRRYDDGFVTMFERRTAPRYYFTSEYRVASPAAALEAIASTAPRELVLEDSPAAPRAPNVDADPAVVVEDLGLNHLRLVVDAPRPGLVYASESHFDGWTATVNGAPARILAANYAFRATEVPAGRVVIEYRYWPPGLTAGLWISALSAVVGLLLLRGDRR